jgi:putative hemolysin
MRRERIVRAADRFCDSAGSKTVGLGTHEQLKNFEACRLPQSRECRERVGSGHSISALLRTDMTDNSQSSFSHRV